MFFGFILKRVNGNKISVINRNVEVVNQTHYEYFFLKLFDASRQRMLDLDDDRSKNTQFLGLTPPKKQYLNLRRLNSMTSV